VEDREVARNGRETGDQGENAGNRGEPRATRLTLGVRRVDEKGKTMRTNSGRKGGIGRRKEPPEKEGLGAEGTTGRGRVAEGKELG